MILLSIDNLSNEINEQEVERLFSQYGKVRSIKLTSSATHSRRPGTGLIEMEGKDAQQVISALDGRLFWGMVLRITEAHNTEKIKNNPPGNSMDPTSPDSHTTDKYIHQPYRVATVEKVTDSELGLEKDWYRYTLICGNSRITGLHRGTIAEVTEYAVNSAHAFNLRNRYRGGGAFSWSSRNKK
jgi:RNA recognition motif-containing protein